MKDRVAIITGASKGLGAELARFLGGQNCQLIVDARNSQALTQTAWEIEQAGGRIWTVSGDILDEGHRKELIAAAERLGRLDLLINNASSLGATPLPRLEQYPLRSLEALFEINVLAPLALIQRALPLMKPTGGLIVNISSDAATAGYPGWGGYGCTKAALDAISRTLANELEESGVAVVSVDPGDMQTDMHQLAFIGEDISDRPLPGETLPFWAWLFGQELASISGRRFEAQAERWEIAI